MAAVFTVHDFIIMFHTQQKLLCGWPKHVSSLKWATEGVFSNVGPLLSTTQLAAAR